MKPALALLVMLGLSPALHAETATTYVYVSLAAEQQIAVLKLDDQGELHPVASVDVDGAPGSLGFSPSKQRLYASLRTTSRLAAFRVDAATGRLEPLDSVALPPGENAAFVTTDRAGRQLISASYAAGKVVVHALNDDGSIRSPALQTVVTAKTAHCVAVDPLDRWVFVPHVATNSIYQFRRDAEDGRLTLAGQTAAAAPDAGPRHLTFHPTGRWAFASNETGSSATAYRFHPDSGLVPHQTLSTLPDDYREKNTTAEVRVHPGGKFVWVSNRGHDSLAGFAFDSTTGALAVIEQTPVERTPRSFAVSPDGRFVLVAGEGTGALAVFRVDLETGRLTPVGRRPLGKSLTWVAVVSAG